MYCPRCASTAVEGQRFCRSCGTNLGAIVDAMEGKRGPIDFDSLKEDLRQLGSSLRAGFEEARQNIKRTQRLAQAATPATPEPRVPHAPRIRVRRERKGDKEELRYSVTPPRVKEARSPDSRKYSFQQATLSIFGGATTSAVLYYLFNTAANSGLVASLARSIMNVNPQLDLTGIEPVFRLLWMLGLVGVAKGLAHLVNGIFFAPKPAKTVIEERAPAPELVPEPPSYLTPERATPTNELERSPEAGFRPSVTEDPTLQFAPREAESVKSD